MKLFTDESKDKLIKMIVYFWKKTIVLYGAMIAVRSVFYDGNKYYPEVFWDEWSKFYREKNYYPLTFLEEC